MAHNKMSIEMRAKQFMPFSALTGFEEALKLKEKEHENNSYKNLKKNKDNFKNILKIIQDNLNSLIEIIHDSDNGLKTLTTFGKEINVEKNFLVINNSEIQLEQILQIKVLN